MAKLRDVILEKPRRKACSVDALDGATKLRFALRLLNGAEFKAVEERARLALGLDKQPPPEDTLYAREKMVQTLLLACVDDETPLESPEPYFADAAEVLRVLDDARITHVYQEQRVFQSEFAPVVERCSFDDFVKLTWASVEEATKGGDPERPFAGLPYRKLVSFATNAAAALTSPGLPQLLFGSPTTAGGDASKSSASSSPLSSEKGS